MGHCTERKSEFARKIDEIDEKIAALARLRVDLMRNMPRDYDCCGEGEAYFALITDFGHAEKVYHAVAEID